MLRDPTADPTGQQCKYEYQNLEVVKYPRICPHSNTVTPGHMDHFIRGYSSLPCTVCETGVDDKQDLVRSEEDKLELINDYELSILIRHYRFIPPLAGFYFSTSSELEGLYYLPDQCRVCQEEEVSRDWRL